MIITDFKKICLYLSGKYNLGVIFPMKQKLTINFYKAQIIPLRKVHAHIQSTITNTNTSCVSATCARRVGPRATYWSSTDWLLALVARTLETAQRAS